MHKKMLPDSKSDSIDAGFIWIRLYSNKAQGDLMPVKPA